MTREKKPLDQGLKPVKPIGRPTTYKPEYGAKIFETMSQGFSLSAACGELCIPRSMVYVWIKEHPELEHLVKAGQDARIRFLENRLLTTGHSAQITAMIFALKCARSEDWKDVSRQEVTGKDGEAIEIVGITRTIVDPGKDPKVP